MDVESRQSGDHAGQYASSFPPDATTATGIDAALWLAISLLIKLEGTCAGGERGGGLSKASAAAHAARWLLSQTPSRR